MSKEEEKKVRFFEFTNNESDTCKKARYWLDENQVDYELINLADKTVTPEEFERWINQSGLRNYELIKPGNDTLRDKTDGMSVKELADYLADHLEDVKRPIIEINRTTILFGFKESKYAEHLGNRNERYMKEKNNEVKDDVDRF